MNPQPPTSTESNSSCLSFGDGSTLNGYQDWMSTLRDTMFEEMHALVVAEKKRRDESALAKRFLDQLLGIERCFATTLTYTGLRLGSKDYSVHPEKRASFLLLGGKLPPFHADPQNRTVGNTIDFLSDVKKNQSAIYIYADGVDLDFLLKSDALRSYLGRLTLDANGTLSLIPQNEFCVLDENDAVLKKHANPYWLRQIRAANAKLALQRINDQETLVQVCVAAMQQ